MIFHISLTFLVYLRMNALRSSDPTSTEILPGTIDFDTTIALVTLNIVLLTTNWFLEQSPKLDKISCISQIVGGIAVLGGIASAAYYGYVNYQIYLTVSPLSDDDYIDLGLAALQNGSMLLYALSFWLVLICLK
jgi:hypothetical protein